MPDYRRYRIPGGTYFFTVNLLERHANDLLIRHIDVLRLVVKETRKRWPFYIDAWVVLPEHLHCVWTLSPGDDDNAKHPAFPFVNFEKNDLEFLLLEIFWIELFRSCSSELAQDGVCNPVLNV